jgi:hypothetical protein
MTDTFLSASIIIRSIHSMQDIAGTKMKGIGLQKKFGDIILPFLPIGKKYKSICIINTLI